MRKTILKFKILFFVLLFSILTLAGSYGQEKFIEGKVQWNNGEISRGFILREKWIVSPETIQFKETESSAPRMLSAYDISLFEFDNRRYVRMDLSEIPNYNKERVISGAENYVFFEVLVSGELSLYVRNIVKQKIDYFVSSDTITLSLIDFNPSYEDELRMKKYGIQPLERHKFILKEFILGCNNLIPNIEYLKGEEKNLIRLISDYNGCRNVQNQFVKVESYEFKEHSLFAQLMVTRYSIRGNSDYNFLNNMTFSGNGFGLGYTFDYFTKSSGAISTEILFNKSISASLNETNQFIYEAEIGLNNLQLNESIKGQFSIRNLKILGQLGFSILHSDVDFEYSTLNKSTGVKIDSKGSYFGESMNYKNFRFGTFLGVGVRYKRVGLNSKYEVRPNIIESKNVSNENCVVFGLSWTW